MVQGLPHDIYSIDPYVRPLWQTVLIGALLVGLLGILWWLFYRWYRQRKAMVPPARVKDSWELLAEELEQLRSRLGHQSSPETRELFYGLSLVLRRGIELATAVRATDLTVQELKAQLKNQAVIGTEKAKDMVAFLNRADLIKFADAQAASGEATTSFKVVEDWLRDLQPSAPLPADNLKFQAPQDSKGMK